MSHELTVFILAGALALSVLGIIWIMFCWRNCQRCDGRGLLERFPEDPGSPDWDLVDCPLCNGSGMRYWPPRWPWRKAKK